MWMRLLLKAGIPACLLLVTGYAHAIKLEPGKWQMQFDGSGDMNGTLMSRKTVECITEADYDPTRAAMMADSSCSVVDMKEDGNTVTWQVECEGGNPGMPAVHGDGKFISEGRTAHGEMVMSLSFGGMDMKQENRWKGRWVAEICE
jgi:hypothetical protein